ncbi:MAG TPA: PEP-CTERM sorting domain-containing protein [Candidatus Acidoferrum sp.]|nr:PEP-CTERM sorting domain-containing protein [Candidatus Acidoferrum sp.]
MSKRSFRLAAVAVFVLALTFCGSAKADTVYVDGSYAFANGGYGIPPYGGTLNGQSAQFFCVDFSTPIWAGETWQVTVTSLTGSNFSLTKLKNQTSYLEMAWLVTQMMSSTSQLQKAMDQYAIWSLSGGPNPYGSNSTLIAAALAAVQGGFTGAGWEILSPTGSAGQEFLVFVGVPEPAELVLLLIGLAVVALATRKNRSRQVQAA